LEGNTMKTRYAGLVEGKNMKPRALRLATMTVGVVISLALPAWGQVTVTMSANATGTGTWESPEGDVYTGVYTGTTSGLPGANPGVVCDDFQDNTYSSETWTATALNAGSLTTSNIDYTDFGKTIGLQGYAEVATLVSYMFSGTSGYTPTELSSAIWYITTAGNASLDAQLWGDMDQTAKNLVTTLQGTIGGLSNTAAQALLSQFSNLWILTPVAGSENPSGDGTPQEMWVSAPEGGAAILYLLLAGITCFGAMYRSRRRQAVGRLAA
jgi:hypothetical protein